MPTGLWVLVYAVLPGAAFTLLSWFCSRASSCTFKYGYSYISVSLLIVFMDGKVELTLVIRT